MVIGSSEGIWRGYDLIRRESGFKSSKTVTVTCHEVEQILFVTHSTKIVTIFVEFPDVFGLFLASQIYNIIVLTLTIITKLSLDLSHLRLGGAVA